MVGPPAGAGGPFLLYEVDAAPALVRGLEERGVAVRHAASFGLPRHIRIGIRDPRANGLLVARWLELQVAGAQHRSTP